MVNLFVFSPESQGLDLPKDLPVAPKGDDYFVGKAPSIHFGHELEASTDLDFFVPIVLQNGSGQSPFWGATLVDSVNSFAIENGFTFTTIISVNASEFCYDLFRAIKLGIIPRSELLLFENRNETEPNSYYTRLKADRQAISKKCADRESSLDSNQKLFTPSYEKVLKKRPLSIDFIIPCMNSSDTLKSTLLSIEKCRQADDEIVIIDDASDVFHLQKTEELAKNFNAKLIKLKQNQGPAAARNVGVEANKNPLIQFVDADDALVAGGVEKFREIMTNFPSIDVLCGQMEIVNHGKRKRWMPLDGTIWTAPFVNCAHVGIMARRATVSLPFFADQNVIGTEDWQAHVHQIQKGIYYTALPILTYRYNRNIKSRSTTLCSARTDDWKKLMRDLSKDIAQSGCADIERSTHLISTGTNGIAMKIQEGMPTVPYKLRYRILDSILTLFK